MTRISKEALVKEIEARTHSHDRLLVGFAGAPGSGKSTIAEDLAARLGPTATVLPMDGFHLDNDRLRQMGLLHRKGAPETFDADGFVALVRKLRQKGTVEFPTFDREADSTVPGAGRIGEDIRIVLIEGNYLLLNTHPWSDLAGLLDLQIRLEVSRDELEARLIRRWLDHGLSPDAARTRTRDNDMANVDYIAQHSREPDYVLADG
ncbi:phosphoribulokinase [Defluviimonas aestuarii]|uniref:phosphoribulokinase n=1 Tax=Albidovulum aestuarii TaxID=1130726 RepID=UPI00249CE913|nr:phosphoribulokinase [Defluviimonas aestuarii]MDI3336292.1 phosphoribulokinase [Defluviimonas aestuarii]